MKRLVQEKKEKTCRQPKKNKLSSAQKTLKRSFTNCGVKQNVKKKDYFINIKQVNQFFR